MRVSASALGLAVALVLAGCEAAPAPIASTTPSTASQPSPEARSIVRVVDPYILYTHCGIREAKVGGRFYVADPELNDGSGNPPSDWGNPSQRGTMTVYSDGTAKFAGPGGLAASFALRIGATKFREICG